MSNAFNLSQLANFVDSSGKLALGTGVTGTLPVANGGTGASTLTANNVILGNGTSAPTFVAPGTNGNVLQSNGTTWVSAASAGGGVTSLNGQTGAITNTTQYAIGSYVMGRPQNFTSYNNATIAGSSLYATSAGNSYGENEGNFGWATGFGYNLASGVSLVNTGSWRCVSLADAASQGGVSFQRAIPGLWVRYA